MNKKLTVRLCWSNRFFCGMLSFRSTNYATANEFYHKTQEATSNVEIIERK